MTEPKDDTALEARAFLETFASLVLSTGGPLPPPASSSSPQPMAVSAKGPHRPVSQHGERSRIAVLQATVQPLCGRPMDQAGHKCARRNGHAEITGS